MEIKKTALKIVHVTLCTTNRPPTHQYRTFVANNYRTTIAVQL